MKPILPLGIGVSILLSTPLQGQTIENGDLEQGMVGWTTCTLESGPESTYGGTGNNTVAEVDADLTTDPDDDRMLCQPISGLTVGALYTLSFKASRRTTGSTPAEVGVTVRMGESGLNTTVTRTGGWDLREETLYFTAAQTTEQLVIAPAFEGSFGMIFDDLAIALVSVLPVELLSFEATPEGDSVRLSWSTASERQNDHFDVERSQDQVQWNTVGRVAGAGYSQQLLTYSTMDPAPPVGQCYYRLKQVDTDGTTAFSDLRSVFIRQQEAVPAWPNPAMDYVYLPSDHLGLHVTNELGEEVDTAQLQLGQLIRIDLSHLPRGLYYLSDPARPGAPVKVIKQ